MKYVTMTQAKANLDEYLEVCESELVVITRSGKPVAYLNPIAKDAELEHLALMANPEFREILARSLANGVAGHTISLEEAMRRLELDEESNP